MSENKKGYYESGEFDAEEHIENDDYRKHMLSTWYDKEKKNKTSNSSNKRGVGQKISAVFSGLTDQIDEIDVKKLDKKVVFGALGVLLLLVAAPIVLFNTSNSADSDGNTLGALDSVESSVTDEGLEVEGEDSAVVKQTVINGTPVNLTSQPMPEEFIKNPSDIRKLALSLEDKVSIDRFATTKGVAYIANLEGGDQAAIFGTGDTLYFVTSQTPIDNDDWKQFIDQL